MSIFTETLTGDATPFEVYGGLAACAHYLLGAPGRGPAAFLALSADNQKRRLIGGTRYVEQQFWQGVATGLAGGVATTLSFPRTGLTDVTGAPLDATNVPSVVPQAVFEMTAILSVNQEAGADADSGSNVSSLGAGPARISFFRPTSPDDGNATVLPTVVDRLIGRWRAAAGASAVFAGFASANPCSDFGSCRCSTSPCCCGSQRRDIRWPL